MPDVLPRLPRLPRLLGRFAGVGVLTTALDVGLFLLLRPHLGVVVANLVSTSAGMALGFTLHGRFTFGAQTRAARQAARFVAVNVVVLWALQPLVVGGVAAVLTPVVGTAAWLPAKLAAVAAVLVVNLVAYRRWVWPEVSGPRP